MVRYLALAMVGSLLILAQPRPALADRPIIVGNGTAASCTETALKSALFIAETIGGATIRFKCGPAPVTIALSQVVEVVPGRLVLLVIPDNTTIDGGGLVTLDGTDTATVVFVDRGTTATLRRRAIVNGRDPFFEPGGIDNFGTLTLKMSTVSANVSGFLAGGISNEGTLTIHDSTISSNAGGQWGGVINRNGGTLIIRNTMFAENISVFDGGGIGNFFGTIKINNSTFLRNQAPDGFGGAIENFGTLIVKDSLFAENFAFRGGGGIANFRGTAKVSHSTFSQNAAILIRGGGGIFNDSEGALTVDDSTFSGNTADRGGAISTSGTLAIKDSIITHNAAFSAGGGIYVCVDVPPCSGTQGTVSLKNTIVTENTPDDIFP